MSGYPWRNFPGQREEIIMKRLMQKKISIACAAMLLMVLPAVTTAGCDTGTGKTGKLVVAVSIQPQAGFVKAVGGDKVDVVVMVPPGASPHTYEVTSDQMVQLSKAKMYAKVGSPVEFELAWMDKLIDINKDMLVVDCSEGISFIESEEHEHEDADDHEGESEEDHHHTGLDPHIWLSIKNATIMTQNICDGLVQVDPANRAYYEKNRADYQKQLDELDTELTDDLQGVATPAFIVFHPSFGYFARDYGLQQIPVETGGKEPEADHLIRVIEEAKEHGITVVFVSPQYNTKSAEMIAREIGGQVVAIDPLAEDFVRNMNAIKEAMKQAMK